MTDADIDGLVERLRDAADALWKLSCEIAQSGAGAERAKREEAERERDGWKRRAETAEAECGRLYNEGYEEGQYDQAGLESGPDERLRAELKAEREANGGLLSMLTETKSALSASRAEGERLRAMLVKAREFLDPSRSPMTTRVFGQVRPVTPSEMCAEIDAALSSPSAGAADAGEELPPIDKTLHTPALIAELQRRALDPQPTPSPVQQGGDALTDKIEKILFRRDGEDKLHGCEREVAIEIVGEIRALQSPSIDRERVLEEAAQAAGLAAWKHVGDDGYSQGMDAGARHQVKACVEAIRALQSHPPSPTIDREEVIGALEPFTKIPLWRDAYPDAKADHAYRIGVLASDVRRARDLYRRLKGE